MPFPCLVLLWGYTRGCSWHTCARVYVRIYLFKGAAHRYFGYLSSGRCPWVAVLQALCCWARCRPGWMQCCRATAAVGWAAQRSPHAMSLRRNACQASDQLSSTRLQGATVLTVPQPVAAILVPVLGGKASHSRFCLQIAATHSSSVSSCSAWLW